MLVQFSTVKTLVKKLFSVSAFSRGDLAVVPSGHASDDIFVKMNSQFYVMSNIFLIWIDVRYRNTLYC